MMKPLIKLNWRSLFPYERLEIFLGPLAVFASSCAIAASYTQWNDLLLSLVFSINLLFLVRFRSSKMTSFVLSATALLLLLFVLPVVPLHCFLLILYPLLLLIAIINTSPIVPFVAGLLSSTLFFIRYQGLMEAEELWANVFAILLNVLVSSLLTHMMRNLIKERNEYKHLSMIDSLTGLSSLQQTLLFGQQLVEKGNKVRVLLIDLDHFKQINDTYGHMVGNKVIVHFANSLKKMVDGTNGIVGRLGGDEFVLVVEDRTVPTDWIDKIVEKLNHSRYVPGPNVEPLTLSFSIGEAVSDPNSTTHIEQLMHQADLNMYEYKLRNRVPLIHNQSEQLFEYSTDPIFTFDINGQLIGLNPAAERLIGYNLEEIRKMPFSTFIMESDRDFVINTFFEHTVKGSPTNYEITIISKNGTKVPVSVTNIPIIANHKIAGFYALAQNMSERKHAEEQLRYTDKMDVMNRIAARFSEEIRIPLTNLIGCSRLMEKESERSSPYYTIIQSELERIEFISNEVMLLSNPISEPIEHHNPLHLMQDAMMILETKAFLSQVTWEVSTKNDIPEVVCEPKQLKHAFVHVLNNAIEAMPNGGRIQVELEHQDDSVTILVRDEGMGLEEKQLRMIGKPFYSSKPNRVGIGLTITMRIMNNHKGSFMVFSEQNAGTTVELKLPS